MGKIIAKHDEGLLINSIWDGLNLLPLDDGRFKNNRAPIINVTDMRPRSRAMDNRMFAETPDGWFQIIVRRV